MNATQPAVPTPAIAFFDVDETLIAVKSMFSFLKFYLSLRGEPSDTFPRLYADLQGAARAGVPREEINRRYYQLYAGHSARALSTAGRSWFDAHLARERHFLLPAPVARLAGHRAQGSAVVLLSGSFFACLDPIAEHVAATWAIGTRPRLRRGELTGEVIGSMIGSRKGRAAAASAWIRGARLSACVAYADHESDLSLLRSVGTPVVVGDDPVLTGYAERLGWERLPGCSAGATESRPDTVQASGSVPELPTLSRGDT